MELRWSLNELYKSFEDEKLKLDIKKCDDYIEKFNVWVDNNLKDKKNAASKAETYINMLNEFYDTYSTLLEYCQLTLSVETTNEKALHIQEILENKITSISKPSVKFQKWIGSLENLDDVINSSPVLKEHKFFLHELYEKNEYLLNEEEENIIAKMRNTGSNAWAKLQDLSTSTLLVDINLDGEDKKLPLSMVRNLAYENDAKIRKTAYEAELKAYEKIDKTSAACLNGIKGEVITVCNLRGYNSPLEETLLNSRMDFEILNSMLTAMKEYMPEFRKYLRKKAELLGHKNGLPFYDLFAPIGNTDMKFTYKEAHDFIVKNFRTFSNSLADFADNAFKNNWIDAEPREGKVGGAFCSPIHSIKESRIMSNFAGNFTDVVTLAHELGHGYHGECLKNETFLNSDYPMPIAETASTFCETIVKNAALKTASKEEAFSILETEISDATQVIVDIYSRYLFESKLFELRKESSVPVAKLKEIMLEAQKEAYGEGLDNNYLHPYMWVCKSHYYYAEANFYNFPYAFGQLFSKGLYAEYLKRGEEFVKEYDKLLQATGMNNLANVASLMNIDIKSVDFWRSSLELIKSDIEKFIALK